MNDNLYIVINSFTWRTNFKISLKKLYRHHRKNHNQIKSSELILNILNMRKTTQLKQQIINRYEANNLTNNKGS